MWLYRSFKEFSSEAAGVEVAKPIKICPGRRNIPHSNIGDRPPVIVAKPGEIPPNYPRLEGRHRQRLPRVFGRKRGRLLADGTGSEKDFQENLDAWFVPWRVGVDRAMVITVKPGTVFVLDVTCWPTLQDKRVHGEAGRSRDRILRRAAKVLSAAPHAFATEPSIGAAYDRMEKVWGKKDLDADDDPQGDLLVKQARQLKGVLEDLGARPRAVLRTEHRMLKLQTVRRTDAKTLRWLSAQPGRNTAERAGARQRIKATKRYETVATLENRVLRAFVALTAREAKNWLSNLDADAVKKERIEAHQLRARRIESILRARGVTEARHPVQPNFPLRFDPRYREIWRAWLELRARSFAAELEWMWQHRTFMELLGLRAAMKLHQAAHVQTGDAGSLAHAPVLGTKSPPNQGHYLAAGVRCTFGTMCNGSLRLIEYRTSDVAAAKTDLSQEDDLLGVVATAGPHPVIWWDAQKIDIDSEGAVGELPWTRGHAWDARLERWAKIVISCDD